MQSDFLLRMRQQQQIVVDHLLQRYCLSDLPLGLTGGAGVLRFMTALQASGLQIIGEVKRASPAVGILRAVLNVPDCVAGYIAAGVAAISVLTEPLYFMGSLTDLIQAKQVASGYAVPVLRKDFLIHPVQLLQSYYCGADAVLLIVALLQDDLPNMIATCKRLGLGALVEVSDVAEIELAVAAGAEVIGVNNRCLHRLRVDTKRAELLHQYLPESVVCVAESGYVCAEKINRVQALGYDAVLIGSAFASASPATVMKRLGHLCQREVRNVN